MQLATILAEENKKLRVANQRQRRKQDQRRQYIASGGVIQVQQAQQLAAEAERVVVEAEQGESDVSARRQHVQSAISKDTLSLRVRLDKEL